MAGFSANASFVITKHERCSQLVSKRVILVFAEHSLEQCKDMFTRGESAKASRAAAAHVLGNDFPFSRHHLFEQAIRV
jgi:hypothetical protein